ncbi:ATP-binding protein [Micromonospora globbae]|jgi:ATP-dependent DNA helicase RecG|uniref:Transcriptional regulator n=1 Tax=Micromonospora globbae TaxID=1894969 RepID=A0A420F6T1_9ACTN|nr:ATP-binding protein [Micromonospora globbae]RKF28644.1 transcriptional regulator [Micromonospora globbae]WTF84036.1 putative DNA binding domain-containing protein [Micromonospora globbae]
MSTDLADLLGTQETAALEFKREATDRNAIRKAICALANDLAGQGGGDLLIGVDDRGRAVGGVDTSDAALLKITEYRDQGLILDRPSMVVTRGLYQGQQVIRVRVNASRTPPVRFENVVYVRPGPSTRRATRDDERVLSERRRSFELPFDVRPAPGSSLAELDLELFRTEYLRQAVAPSVLEENHRSIEQQLASLRLADLDGAPTVLGLLVVGVDPTNRIPGAYVQFVRYEGNDVGGSVLDEQEIRLNVINTAERLESLLKGHLRSRLVEVTGFREEARPNYPFEALRELVMNAMMHRNYESSNAPVRIAWFDDRIEVTNPGGPFGQVRADNFDRVNDYRNPSLAAAMKSLGYVNQFGRGIGRVRAALARNGNPEADFAVDDASWTVTVRSAS